jgi:hypothetical protein
VVASGRHVVVNGRHVMVKEEDKALSNHRNRPALLMPL